VYPLPREDVSSGMARVNWKSWVTFPAYLLVFLMLVFPMVFEFSRVKLFLFVVILATVGVMVLTTSKLYLHPALVVWTLSLSALSFLFVLVGLFKGAPVAGSVRTTQVYVVWPMIYLLVIAGVRSKRILFGLMWTVAISTICIPIYSLVYLLIQTNVLPENRYFDLNGVSGLPFPCHRNLTALSSLSVDGFVAQFRVRALVRATRILLGSARSSPSYTAVLIFSAD
jgi:hypothetical protein